MLTINELQSMRPSMSQQITTPIRVNVVCIKEDSRIYAALADLTGCIKATVTKDQLSKLKGTVMIRNFTLGRNVIFIQDKTVISRCATIDISPAIEQQAKDLIQPPVPPTRQIIDICKSPSKTLTTVVATVEQVCTFNSIQFTTNCKKCLFNSEQ